MIALEQVAVRRAPLALASVSLSVGAGVHAIVGAPRDGAALLLEVVAGRVRPRAGRVRVLEGVPGDVHVRPQVAWVPLEPALPEGVRVGEVLGIAASIRGDEARPAAERLGVLGIEALAARPVRGLSSEERRAVALAEAVTSTRVRVLLVEEPLVAMDPRAAPLVAAALRARARDGVAVLASTASVRDAGELADDHLVLRAGAVVGRAASLQTLAGASRDGARVVIVCSDPHALLACLARDGDVDAVARRDGAVVARGRDAVALARAGARAVVESGVDVREMRLEPPSLDEARAALVTAPEATP